MELVFQEVIDLPEFASFPLVEAEETRQLTKDYYHRYLAIAVEMKTGSVTETDAFGYENKDLLVNLTGLKIFGGCCGMDLRHVRSIAKKYPKRLL